MDIDLPKQERPRNRWTPSLDKVLADLVVKQIELGNRQNYVFDRKTWNHIRDEFNNQTNLNYNINQLRKHLEVLRQRYDKLKSSRVQNEFVLEDNGCMLGFDLWEDLGVQPRSDKPVKVKDSPIYEQLCIIFDDDTTEGKYAQSSHFEGLEDSVANPTTSPTPRLENQSTPNVAEVQTNLVERKRKREPDSRPTSNSRQIIKPAALETIAGALSDMVTAFKSRVVADFRTEDESFSITNCINVLDEFENVDEGVYLAALDLFENPGLRETFMSLRGNKLRLTWLQSKCRNLSSSVAQLG